MFGSVDFKVLVDCQVDFIGVGVVVFLCYQDGESIKGKCGVFYVKVRFDY